MSYGPALIGRTLAGRFRVTGFIGEGAMAAVYRGFQEAEEPHDVALKIMHPHLLTDPTFVGRFRREAKAASLLKHPNSVQIIDCGVDEKLLYIAMELMGGQDLFELLVLERRLPEAQAARIMIQVCGALSAAHALGIVHRDLKPENIMLIPDDHDLAGGVVKVLDFGIAKILEREQPAPTSGPVDSSPASSLGGSLTTVGTVVGTPSYMSPEQCRAEAIDARSDIYSCGVVLYQLVTGRLPFSGDNPMDLAIKHVREEPPPPRSILPSLHPGLEAAILTSLSKWPAQRQQSAGELKEELEKLLPELSTARPPRPARKISPEGVTLASADPSALLPTPTPAAGAPPKAAEPAAEVDSTTGDGLDPGTLLSAVPEAASERSLSSKRRAAVPEVRVVAPEPVEAAGKAEPAGTPPAAALAGAVGASTPAAAAKGAAPSAAAAEGTSTGATSRREVTAVDKLRSAAPATVRPRRRKPTPLWVVVPIAVFLGAALGVVAFFLLR